MGTRRTVTTAVALLPLSLGALACGTQRPGELPGPADVRGIDIPTQALAATMDDPVMAEPVAASPARAVRVRAAVAVPAPTRTELDDVPTAALTAYHRGATVMNSAAKECGLQWHLLAAIGRVETEHGHGRLDDDGLATPALVGAPLNGRHQRPRVRDTDAGQLDGDRRWDRVVGPFRMLPATWSVVAVDADGDGTRNPQDIDDAALGTAVLLCGSKHDLSTREGMRKALRELRSQPGYAATVLGWFDAYVEAEVAMASMSVAPSVIRYGDWSGAVQQVTDLANTPPPASEPAPGPKRKPRPKKSSAKDKPEPAKATEPPEPTAKPPAEAAPAEPVAQPPAEQPPAEQPPAEQPPAEQPPAGQPPADKPPADGPGPGGGTGGSPPACEPTDPADPNAPPPPPDDTSDDEATDPACQPADGAG